MTMHILFADDTGDTRNLYALAFILAGHTVREAFDGEQAVVAVEQEHFDVIVLDVQMPHLDGWQALARIRALPNGRTVPIALFTAAAGTDDVSRARAAGADTLIAKPIMPKALLIALRELVLQRAEDNGP